jgi:hypothetical protein
VGGKGNIIELSHKYFNRGITFEAPRHSLMIAIQYEIFDDMLIGNFMRTILHGKLKSSPPHCIHILRPMGQNMQIMAEPNPKKNSHVTSKNTRKGSKAVVF